MANPCVLSDEQSFPSGRGDTRANCLRDVVVPGLTRAAITGGIAFGHLFSGRFKAERGRGQPGLLETVCDYVHLNPVRAKLIEAGKPVKSHGAVIQSI
jgi:hypothetical protein